jgi:hypothetical protein
MNLQSEKTITIYLPIYFEKKKRERTMFIYKIFCMMHYAGIRPNSPRRGSGLDVVANAEQSQSGLLVTIIEKSRMSAGT